MDSSSLKKPELLSPAGNWPALLSAIDNGADSVYFGIKDINMRALAGNFELSEMKKIMDLLRRQGKKGYLTLNTIAMDDQIPRIERIMRKAKEAKVNAVILWDMGIFDIAKQEGLPIHLSTQASAANNRAIQWFFGQGIERIVLARECSFQDIQKIKETLKNNHTKGELEVFVHGAMCLSISGRCFMSKYSHGLSANEGECTQPCRREYEIKVLEGEEHFIAGTDYVMSPKDLCAIDFIDDLIECDIDCFKIEGRMRSPEYTAVVTSVYRQAIDAYWEGTLTPAAKKELKQKLQTVYNRGFSSGFYFGKPDNETSRQLEHRHEKMYLGEVKKYYKRIQVADVLIRNNGLKKGQEILIFGKRTPASYATVGQMQQDHLFVDTAKKGEHVGVKLPFNVRKGDKVFLWKKRDRA